MDKARVAINLKEGIIELQGPIDFVQYYLDRYRPVVKEVAHLPEESAPRETSFLPRKRKAAGRRNRGSYAGSIRSLLEGGFFDEARSMVDVRQRLNDAGLACPDNTVWVSLKRLSTAGLLDRVGKGRTVLYRQPMR